MSTLTKLVRLGAVAPTAIAGSLIAAMLLSFLPAVGAMATLSCVFAGLFVLGCGWWESPAARILGIAHGMRAEQHAVLAPALGVLEPVGLAPQRLLVRVADTTGPPAAPIGRHTVILQPWLLRSLREERLAATDAAAVIAHAVASQRVGPARFDLLARLWNAPWALMIVIVRWIAGRMSWVPAARLSWHMRGVVGLVVVCQGFQPGGNPALGLATGLAFGLSYAVPAADRRWRRTVERDADQVVAQRGLGDPLVSFVQWRSGAGHLDRVHRIRELGARQPLSRQVCRAVRTDLLWTRGPTTPPVHSVGQPS